MGLPKRPSLQDLPGTSCDIRYGQFPGSFSIVLQCVTDHFVNISISSQPGHKYTAFAVARNL